MTQNTQNVAIYEVAIRPSSYTEAGDVAEWQIGAEYHLTDFADWGDLMMDGTEPGTEPIDTPNLVGMGPYEYRAIRGPEGDVHVFAIEHVAPSA